MTETLEVIPRRWKVIQTVREKFTCRECEKLSQAPAPYHAVPRGWAGANLLATIVYEKYGQHQPLNRQSERYAREGVELSLSTLADQVGACAFALRPLHELIAAHVLEAQRLHGDDTPVPVLAKGKTDTARAWVYVTAELGLTATPRDSTSVRPISSSHSRNHLLGGNSSRSHRCRPSRCRPSVALFRKSLDVRNAGPLDRGRDRGPRGTDRTPLASRSVLQRFRSAARIVDETVDESRPRRPQPPFSLGPTRTIPIPRQFVHSIKQATVEEECPWVLFEALPHVVGRDTDDCPHRAETFQRLMPRRVVLSLRPCSSDHGHCRQLRAGRLVRSHPPRNCVRFQIGVA